MSGVLLVLLGLWGGLIAFVGPYADFGYTPDETWVYSDDRFWLNIAPALATGLGGLIVLLSANRAIAIFGAWLAALGGAWFVVGGPASALWTASGGTATGTAMGGQVRQFVEQLTFYTGLGVVIVFLAALALGRFAVVGVREARLAEAAAPVHASDESATQPMARPAPPDWEPADQGPARSRGRYARAPEPSDQKVAGTPTRRSDHEPPR